MGLVSTTPSRSRAGWARDPLSRGDLSGADAFGSTGRGHGQGVHPLGTEAVGSAGDRHGDLCGGTAAGSPGPRGTVAGRAAWRSGWTRTLAALVVAVVWAAAVFAFDLGCVALSLVFTVLILAGRRQRRGEAKRCRQRRGARSGNATTFD
ncbi:hypothetical protein Adeh_2874 [Anaeromyxobacter dehalogenans 2CP-C]|uniref:Uncharacterized protein n=1 Tax=Anaeromyxobacter dehalogenans (strain 2CP-C) TaxID=290397 RepID=Q2IDI4_ANADE|nr:hypothetical protein Adeh_2874 [Anaeromyxobacter dehalogenans 2CP-C]